MKIFYGWVIVAVGIVVTCVGFGAMMSLAVFMQPMSVAMGWSRTGIATAALLNFLAMAAGAFAWGALSDRFGTRADERTRKRTDVVIDRARETKALMGEFRAAQRGAVRVVFLNGSPGSGKTTVADHFLTQLRASGQPFSGVSLPVDEAGRAVPLWQDVIAAGVAVFSYSVFFSTPLNLLPWPVVVGMLAHALRWATLTVAAAMSSLLAKIAVGLWGRDSNRSPAVSPER